MDTAMADEATCQQTVLALLPIVRGTTSSLTDQELLEVEAILGPSPPDRFDPQMGRWNGILAGARSYLPNGMSPQEWCSTMAPLTSKRT